MAIPPTPVALPSRTPAPPAPRAPSPALEALRLADFRLLLVMQLAAGLRGPMLFLAQAWYVASVAPEGQRVVMLGLLGAIRGAAFLAYVLVGGAIADRYPRRPALLVAHAVALAAVVLIAALLALPSVASGDGPWLWVMLALFGSFGLVLAQDMPTRTAMIRDAVPPRLLTSAITIHQFALPVTMLVAAPVTGWALDHLGFAWTYLLAGVTHVLVLVAGLRLRLPDAPADPDARAESLLANLRAGVAALGTDAALRWTVLLTWLAYVAGMSVMGVLIAAWVQDVLRLDASGWGVMVMTWAAGGLLASAWLTWRGNYGRVGLLFLGGAAVMGIAVVGFGFSRSVPPAFAFNALAGLGFQVILTVGTVIVQRLTPNRLLGRVMGLLLLSQGLMQVAGLLVGALAQLVGLTVVYPAAGIVLLVLVLTALAVQRPLRELR